MRLTCSLYIQTQALIKVWHCEMWRVYMSILLYFRKGCKICLRISKWSLLVSVGFNWREIPVRMHLLTIFNIIRRIKVLIIVKRVKWIVIVLYHRGSYTYSCTLIFTYNEKIPFVKLVITNVLTRIQIFRKHDISNESENPQKWRVGGIVLENIPGLHQ